MIIFLLVFKLTLVKEANFAELGPAELVEAGHQVVVKGIKMLENLLVGLVKLKVMSQLQQVTVFLAFLRILHGP